MSTVEKFSRLKKKFRELYLQGVSYAEMSSELRVGHMTLREWREKMNLPLRRDRSPRSWMDVQTGSGSSPRQILESIAPKIGITKNDIAPILVRVEKLKTKGLIKGRSYEHVILASAFLYLRWEGSDRRPLSAEQFASICSDFGLTKAGLLMTIRPFMDAGLFPKKPLTPEVLLERSWRSLQDKYSLPETVKSRILTLMNDPEMAGKTPSTVVAGCTYVASLESGYWVLQEDLSKFFGITEVSLRNILNGLRKNNPSARIRPLDMVTKRRIFQ